MDTWRENAGKLLAALKEKLPELEELRDKMEDREDEIYRFYHTSFKVYYLQMVTMEAVELLKSLHPGPYNAKFEQILSEGTGKVFERSHNREWMEHTRPILEAFFHARYFIKMACKYGRELEDVSGSLPSGWAGLLYFYNLR